MAHDPYLCFARRYDAMYRRDPKREQFLHELFAHVGAARVLDCACGTGRDLVLFGEFGLQVEGSDLSQAMLAQHAGTWTPRASMLLSISLISGNSRMF